jgi:hypothetical protein
MGPGLPGVGIASFFYAAAALVAPFRELYLIARGRSSPERRRMVAVQAAIATGIVISVVLLYLGLGWLARQGIFDVYRRSPPPALRRFPNYLWAVFALITVLAASTAYAFWVRITRPADDLRAVAAEHRASVGQRRPVEDDELVIDLRGTPVDEAAEPAVALGAG